jgi:integrase
VLDRLIPANPAQGLDLPAEPRNELVIPTIDEVAQLADAFPDDMRAAVWVGAAAGLRTSEAMGLRVESVDFLRRTITVNRQIKNRELSPRLKSHASYRAIPVSEELITMLAHHVEVHGPGPEGVLFHRDGRLLGRHQVSLAMRNAGVVGHFHNLRHFYASMLIAGGQSVKVVQKRLGHASATITLDTYGHLWPDNEDETRDVVSRLLFGQLKAV